MKEQANQGAFDWEKSKASIAMLIENGRVNRLQSAAALVSDDPNIRGQVVTYSADVNVITFDGKKKLTFEIEDEKTKVRAVNLARRIQRVAT